MTPIIRRDRNAWRDLGKPRSYRTDNTCKEKRRSHDEVAIRAIGAVDLAEAQDPRKRLWCYRCKHCRGWHLTSKNEGARWEIKP